MTCERTLKKLSARPVKTHDKGFIIWHIPVKLYTQLDKLKLKVHQLRHNQLSCLELNECLNQIYQKQQDTSLSSDRKLALKEYELLIMDAIHAHLKKLNPIKDNKEKQRNPSYWEYVVKVVSLAMLGSIGFIEYALWDYFGMQELISNFFPTLLPNATITIALLATTLNLIMYIGFEVNMLQQMLGVDFSNQAVKLLKLEEETISITKKINKLLFNVFVISSQQQGEYRKFVNLALKFNSVCENKRKQYEIFEEHSTNKMLRWGLTIFSGLMVLVGAYFSATSFLTTVAPTLLETSLFSAVFAVLSIGSLGMFFSMRGGGIISLLNPTLETFERIQDKLKSFTLRTTHDFNRILQNKMHFKQDGVDTPVAKEPKTKNNINSILSIDSTIPNRQKPRLRYSY